MKINKKQSQLTNKKMEISEKMMQSCKEFAANPVSKGGFKWKPNSGEIKTSFELSRGLRIYITCCHVYHKGEFILSCYPIGIDTMVLKSQTALEAANEAILIVRQKAQSIIDALTPKS